MANEIKRPNVTFYLYNKTDNKLRTVPAKLYIKHNVKSKGFESDSFTYHEPIGVTFEKGIYVLSLDKVGSDLVYDQIYEFLSFYNNEGGKITKGSKDNGTDIRNGLRFDAKRSPCYVSMEVKKIEEDKVKIVKEEVKIQTIPKTIAETLSFIQLRDLCQKWGIEIPGDIEESGTSEEFVNRYIKLLGDRLTD